MNQEIPPGNLLGLTSNTAALVPYDYRWPDLFLVEKNRIEASVPQNISIKLEHVGSTSISGLAAKPILDLMVGITWNDFSSIKATLEGLDYTYRGTPHDPADHVFLLGKAIRTHAVHVVENSGIIWKEKIFFRDQLREFPALAQQYEKLKESLVMQFSDDRRAYTAGKVEFIRNVLKQQKELV